MKSTQDEISRLRGELAALSKHETQLRKQLRQARKKREAKREGRKHRAVACDEESYDFIKKTADENGVTCIQVVRMACAAYLHELSHCALLLEFSEEDGQAYGKTQKTRKTERVLLDNQEDLPV